MKNSPRVVGELVALEALAEAKKSKVQKQNHPHELTPKSWTPCPTKGVLFYEQVQQAVQAKGS